MKKKEFSYRERDEILKALKEIYSNSEKVTYKQLEEIQKQKWGGVAYKWSTLRNKASLEGWNRKKGMKALKNKEEKKKEYISLVDAEPIELLVSQENDEYQKVIMGIGTKYKDNFIKVKGKLKEALEKENIKDLKYVEAAIRTIRSARKLDIELLGLLDVEEQRRIEIELLRVEMLALEKNSKIR